MEFIQYVAAAGLGSCHRAWNNKGQKRFNRVGKTF